MSTTGALLEEAFLESDFDDIAQAKQARSQRAAQLQAQGFHCSEETCFRVHDGRAVFILRAQPSDSSPQQSIKQRTPLPKLQSKRDRA